VNATVDYFFQYDAKNDQMRMEITSVLPSANVSLVYTRASRGERPRILNFEDKFKPKKHPVLHPAVPSPPTRPTVERSETQTNTTQAFVTYLPNSWVLTEEVFQLNALIISLQGLMNRQAPKAYIRYPAGWDFTYTPHVQEYLERERNFSFKNLSVTEAASTFVSESRPTGYVLWDPSVRESLAVAYTAAGVEHAVVATVAQVSMLKSMGLSLVADFSTRFRNQSAPEIYRWAKDTYWDKTSKEYLIWAGGACAGSMQPGIMDFGIVNNAFVCDLSTKPSDTEEYALAKELMSEMGDAFTVLGWHSYCKDYEHTFTTLASSFGGRVHGLNTNPNVSFQSKIPVSPGFKFRNQRHKELHKESATNTAPQKVFLSLVQTDGLGLGSWTKPGRGEIPYTWEVTIADLDIQPALLQMFYEEATPNDYFVGALGGPGYTYPNAVPPALLPKRLAKAADMMKTLDLNQFVIFDASKTHGPHTVCGDTNIEEPVVHSYFQNMDGVNGFFNGYAPSFTFAQDRTGGTNRSFLSFNYYLDPSRSVEDAASDLQELAELNSFRPYFLTVHVREFGTIDKVQRILSRLPAEFEVTPSDVFFSLVNQYGSYPNRFGP